MNETNSYRKIVVPKLQQAGWDNRLHAIDERRAFTGGRSDFVGDQARREFSAR